MTITLQVVGVQATEEEERQVVGGARNGMRVLGWGDGQCVKTPTMYHLQGPELGHVVETGHGQSADVVVVEGAEEGEERRKHRPIRSQTRFMG